MKYFILVNILIIYIYQYEQYSKDCLYSKKEFMTDLNVNNMTNGVSPSNVVTNNVATNSTTVKTDTELNKDVVNKDIVNKDVVN